MIVNGEEIDHPLPVVREHFFYPNAQGLAYEAQHVRECLLKGKTLMAMVHLHGSFMGRLVLQV